MLGRVGKVGRLGSIGGLEGIPAPDLQLNFDQASIGANAAPDDAIDFSRASNATFTDSDGLVKYAPHNLCLQSEDMGTTWSATNTTVTTNNTTAPDGTTTADKITEDTSTGVHTCNISLSSTDPTGFTSYSAYFKTNGRDEVSVRLDSATTNYILVLFNISTGTIVSQSDNGNGTLESSSITDVGNGWFRVTISGIIDTSGSTIRVLNNLYNAASSYTGDGTSGIFMWGVQISKHRFVPVGNPYIKTTSAAVYGARLDHEAGYFLSADQAQNLVEYSEEMDNSAWASNGSPTVTANNIASPDGATTAEKIAGSGNSFDGIKQSIELNTSASYAFSVHLKRGDTDKSRVGLFDGSAWVTFVDVAFSASGVPSTAAGTYSSVEYEDKGDGWYRVKIIGTSSSTVSSHDYYIQPDRNGDTTFLYAWGAQLEVGSSVGTYVKTEGLPYYGGGATQNGLLIEEQRVNLLSYSENFTDSFYTSVTSPTLVDRQLISPFGLNQNTYETTTAGGRQYVKTIGVTTKSYTASIFVKRVSDTTNTFSASLGLAFGTSGNFYSSEIMMNLNTGASAQIRTGTPDDYGFVDYGNGWYRIFLTLTDDGSGSSSRTLKIIWYSDADTSGGSYSDRNSYIFGMQFEEGAFPTSYIPTSGSTVTRSADLATMGPVTGTNLILQSEDLSTTWTALRSTVNTNAVVAPDGLTTADTIVEDTTASNNHFVFQNFTLDADKIYVYSFYAKGISGATNRNIAVQVQAKDNSFPGIIIDPSAGTVGSTFGGSIAGGIQDVGNDWYRGHVVFDSQSGAVNGQVYAILLQDGGGQSYTGDGSSGMHIWGAQVEQAPTLITDAEDFSAWVSPNSGVTTNVIAAPDGNTTADKITEDAVNSAHYIYKNLTLTGNTRITCSVFAKAAEREELNIAMSSTFFVTSSANATFHLGNETVTPAGVGNPTGSITNVGNGWYRCVFSVTISKSGTGQAMQTIIRKDGQTTYLGDGSSGLYLWGAQLEEGASATPYPPVPTKYLPTYASTNLPFVGYNLNEGTIESTFKFVGLGTTFSRVYCFQLNNNDRFGVNINSNANGLFENYVDAVNGNLLTFNQFNNDIGDEFTHIFAYKENDASILRLRNRDGVLSVSDFDDTSLTTLDGIDEFGFGCRPDTGTNVSSQIFKNFRYYSSKLKKDFLKRLR